MALEPAAAEFVAEDPFAFILAASQDRGTKAEIIWTIPYWLRRDLGHLDPAVVREMTTDDLASAVSRLPKKPRYVSAAPLTILSVAGLVAGEFGGDAERIWTGRTAREVQHTLMRIHGVGPGIAAMAVILLERTRGVQWPDWNVIDVKPDVRAARPLPPGNSARALRGRGVGSGGEAESCLPGPGRLAALDYRPAMVPGVRAKVPRVLDGGDLPQGGALNLPQFVALIPCSGSKLPGGTTDYRVHPWLPEGAAARLQDRRTELASLLGLPLAPDLRPETGNEAGNAFLPAYRRYSGKIYKNAGLTQQDATHPSVRIIIVSALYGLVGPLEPIRLYNLTMDDTLPDRRKVHPWWRDHGSREILGEALAASGEAEIHDLLSTKYQLALQPWPPPGFVARTRIYDYPRRFQASDYDRGDDLRALLDGTLAGAAGHPVH